jgi:hypothetical protein
MHLCNERCQSKNCINEEKNTQSVGNQQLTAPGPARPPVRQHTCQALSEKKVYQKEKKSIAKIPSHAIL